MSVNLLRNWISMAILVFSFPVCLLSADGDKLNDAQRPQSPSEVYSGLPPPGLKPADGLVLQQRNPRYRLRYGDVLELKFPLTPDFDQEKVTIHPDGYISLVGIGDVHVEGRTVDELSKAIKDGYSTVLRDPVIHIKLLEFEKPYFVVGGEVKSPGKYDMRGNTTVAQAVSIAGGMVPQAKHSSVLLFRNVSDEWVKVIQVDLKKMYGKADLTEDLHLKPGDMIFVPKSKMWKMKDWMPSVDALVWMGLRGF